MSVPFTLSFTDLQAGDPTLTGGKGANLALLTKDGFEVPPGFVVTTAANQFAMAESGIAQQIAEIVGKIDYDKPEQVEELCAQVRALIVSAEMPGSIAREIEKAYLELGDEPYVAVRSSGTAEDLAGASFAGLYDTYLDIQGLDDVLDAVKRCWASLWTARSTSYRYNKGFEHSEVQIGVVVMRMVDSDVSGVMFTGNPMTTATDEIVINASWGLGEAIVQGITGPDQYILDSDTLKVKETIVGTKERWVVRDPATGSGTVEQETPADKRDVRALSDQEIAALGDLGRRVQARYGEMPQDIEWAYENGELFLLQSRPITGVDFSWDSKCEDWQSVADSDRYVYTRTWPDEVWTGAVTPLFYSIRGAGHTRAHMFNNKTWGFPEVANLRMFTYHKGNVYYNTAVEEALWTNTQPQMFRPGLVGHVAPNRREEFLQADFSWSKYLRLHARIIGLEPNHGVRKWLKVVDDYIFNKVDEAKGLTNEELRRLSDEALIRYAEDRVEFENKYVEDVVLGFWIYMAMAMNLLAHMVFNWYDGDNPHAFADLITGTRKRTATVAENFQLWELSKKLRARPALVEVFNSSTEEEYLDRLEAIEGGAAWVEEYRAFVAANAHRGQSDRDIYFPRRSDDPALDFGALRAFLSTDESHDPEVLEHAANARREETFQAVVENLRKQSLGFAKAEAFKVVFDYVQRCLVMRDDERYWVDFSTHTIKRTYEEMGRRLLERGVTENRRDFYFLTRFELYELFRGQANLALATAKIAARAKNFDQVDKKELVRPTYLQARKPVSFEAAGADDSSGVLRGLGTSRGVVTGTARIVKELKEIGRVRNGEILVVNSTDPGWTPVFLVIKGIVLETGGMLAHGSCLAREYGFPAVQLEAALQRIPDGATITIDGDAGTVVIVDPDVEREDQ